jgi:hypothetical protein
VATIQTPFLKRYPWLYAISAVALLGFFGYFLRQRVWVREASELHKVTLQEIAQMRPTTGTYAVSGGLLNYVYAQAVGFTNDRDKDRGTYDSFVPCIDPQTKQVVMLVEFKNESPRTLDVHRDDPPANSIVGFFYDPTRVDPAIYQGFANRSYPVSKDTPVMEVSGGVDPDRVKRNNIVAGILALLFGGGPWVLMYLVSRPKKPQKRFSDRYPERKIY